MSRVFLSLNIAFLMQFVSSGRLIAQTTVLNSQTITVKPTDDVTIIGWIDGSPLVLPSGANEDLVGSLNNPLLCSEFLVAWSIQNPIDIENDIDRQYANVFLIKNSANSRPPAVINPDDQLSKGDFRLFNRLQVSLSSRDGKIIGVPNYLIAKAVSGQTPNPCFTAVHITVPSETNVNNGALGISASGSSVFQIAEGRVGTFGQAGDTTLNDPGGQIGATTPWIWSVVRFDANGNLDLFSPLSSGKGSRQIFPTFNIYKNGSLLATFPQGDLETFIALDDRSAISRSDP